MHQRDLIALIVGVALGLASWGLTEIAGVGGVLMFIWGLFLFPLITSVIAAKRIFLAGLVPNIVAMTALLIFTKSPQKQTSFDIWYNISGGLAMCIGSALLMSGAVWLVRRKIMRER